MQYSSITYEGEGASRVAVLRDLQNNTEARVAVGMGFNVFSFKVPTPTGMADVLYAEEGFPKAGMRATSSGTPILVPFPNRIAGGKFTYDGKDYSLPLNSQGVNAIHGFAFDKPWRIVNQSPPELPPSITGEFEMLRDSEFTEEHWPGNFRVRCEVRLQERRLLQQFIVTNLSAVNLPFGLGTHPYFRLTGEVDRCAIFVESETVVELEETIPTGNTIPVDDETRLSGEVLINGVMAATPINIGSRKLDHVYSDLRETQHALGKTGSFAHSHSINDLQKDCLVSTKISHSSDFPFVVVYIPPHRKAICVEPYTCVTNAINMGDRLGTDGPSTGLWHLEPGEVRTVKIETEVLSMKRGQ